MNNNEDQGKNVIFLLTLVIIIVFIFLWLFRNQIAEFQKIMIYIDLYITSFFPDFLKITNFDKYYSYVIDYNKFDVVGYDIIDNIYWNMSNGNKVVILNTLYKKFYILNTFIISLFLTPFLFIIYKLFSKKIIKSVIKFKQEEVYPGFVKSIFRKDTNKIFEIMDYIPPIIENEKEYIEGSIRISKKILDNNFIEESKRKMLLMKKTLEPYDYLKLIYLHPQYIRNITDLDLLDYLRYLRYKGMKPKRNNNKHKLPKLPDTLTKENKNKVVSILKYNLMKDFPDKEYGRLIVPSYYVLTPLENKNIDEFETKGISELSKILKHYVLDDYVKELENTIKELKKENKALAKDTSEGISETIEQNNSLILEMNSQLSSDYDKSRKSKIVALATQHKYEETFIIGLLNYGRTLVNLPLGVLSYYIKFKNPALWYCLTSIGRTYSYKAGLPITIIFDIENIKEEKVKSELDPELYNPDEQIKPQTMEEIKKDLGESLPKRRKNK